MMEFPAERFSEAVELWKEWNSRINVVSRKDVDFLYEHHILHSLAIAEYAGTHGIELSGASVLDVGTGGGFPGIPLAMAYPQARFTLCDSIGKKIKVASAVAEGLGLKNVRCVNCRAEDIGGKFDWVVSRAVTSLENLYPWIRNSFGSGVLCLKGGDVEEEISRMTSKYGVPRGRVDVWPVSDWLEDEYYAGKYVVCIKGNI